jgi:hypothetical protein
MGLSVTLYRINNDDFSLLVQDPENFSPQNANNGFETFEKTFEGLCFVLSKGRLENEVRLIHQIFYPEAYVGDQLEESTINFENLPDDLNFPFTVSYINPILAKEISNFLSLVTIEEFRNNYNHDELNTLDIYPSGVWNILTDPDCGFNVSDLTNELHRLKLFFKSTSEAGDYVLVYNG